MTAVVFYFQVHQPYRLWPRPPGGLENASSLFDDRMNREIVERVAERCYLPMNAVLQRAIEEHDGAFRCAFSLSGTVLDQLEDWAPEALASFQDLADTGCVEFLCETSCHSLAALADAEEFAAQVGFHRRRIEALFGQRPTTFRNTELIIDDRIARQVEDMGFDVLLAEGADHLLDWRSPRHVYRPGGCRRLKLLLRDYLFSDDIAFRFSNPEWPDYPLKAETFAEWLHRSAPEDRFIGLYMDYETFGEHQGAHTGIFDFMEHVPRYVLEREGFSFETPSELAARHEPEDEIHVPTPTSWADAERDVSAWLRNPMQRTAHEALYALGREIREQAESEDDELLRTWRRLTTSDHVYYMATKLLSDGDVHEYFTPYDSPHESFVVFMDALDELRRRLRSLTPAPTTKGSPNARQKEPERQP